MKKLILYLLTFILVLSFFVFKLKETKAQVSSFSFTAVGDYGSDSATSTNRNNVLRGIGSANVNFHLGLGDYLYSNTLSLIPSWCQNVKNMINEGAGKVQGDSFGENFPVELVIGNHDSGESNSDSISTANSLRDCLPHRIDNIVQGQQINGSAYGVEYYFDYPSTSSPLARFILIAPDITGPNFTGWNYVRNDAHYNFVRNSILSARTSNIPWVIVGMHKNCLTNGVKGCEIGTDLFNLLTGKDLDSNSNYPSQTGYGQAVDLILQGHEHTYHRSKDLKTNPNTCTGFQAGNYDADCVTNQGPGNFTKAQGAILAIVGTGGVSIRTLATGSDPETPYFNSWMGANETYPTPGLGATWGLLKVNVTQNQLTGQFLARSGGTFTDTFNISASSGGISQPTPTPTSFLLPSPTVVTPSLTPTCSVVSTNNGQVQLQISLSTAGNYKIWSRMFSSGDNANSYYLQIDNQCPVKVGDLGGLDDSNWTWVDYRNGDTANKIIHNLTAGSHTVNLIGNESNLKLDKLIFTQDLICVPTGINGSECLSQVNSSPTSIPQVVTPSRVPDIISDSVPPTISLTNPINGAVIAKRDLVSINADATDNVRVTRVAFYINGSLKCSDPVAPYSCSWKVSGKPGARFNLKAIALDDSNNSSSSEIIVISE